MAVIGRPRVAVIGSINTDLVVYAPRLPTPGETVIGGDLLIGGGGKGANQAVAAARLGAEVRFLARVGDDDFAKAAAFGLGQAGIDTSLLMPTERCASGVAMIVVDERGENLIALAPGANARLTTRDVDAAWSQLSACTLLILQLEVPIDATAHAAQLARRAGMTVVLNPAPAPTTPLPAVLFESIDVIVPNEHEAHALTGVRIQDHASAGRAARELAALGPRQVIVTLGGEGCVVYAGSIVEHVPAAKVEPIDTTAAGDAFCGGLAVALAGGSNLLSAAQFATQVAGLAVTRPGAQASMPTRAEVERHVASAR